MKILIIFIAITFSNLVCGAIPTVEGLLRNSGNPEVENDTVVMKIRIEKKSSEHLLIGDTTQNLLNSDSAESVVLETTSEDNSEIQNIKPIYMKLIFSNIENKPTDLLQIIYEHSQMNKESIINVSYFRNLEEMAMKDQNSERVLLYSLFSMYGLNKSKIISNLLSKYNVDYRTNRDMLDPEKHELMKKYKSYLEAVKKDEELKDSMSSPLVSEDDVENEKLKEVMKRRMYLASNKVKLTRENGKFYWRVKLENFKASFSNVKQNLLKFELTSPNGKIKSTISNYVLFDGSHELPKNVIIKDIIDNTFLVNTLSYSTFNSKNKTLRQRHSEYLKFLEKSESKNTIIPKEYFVY